MMPRDSTPLTVVKLSDYGGQYLLMLTCGHCGHKREARPETFAKLMSWDAALAAVLERLRCSRCGANRCMATVHRQHKRDG
jgi:hypothetical protein